MGRPRQEEVLADSAGPSSAPLNGVLRRIVETHVRERQTKAHADAEANPEARFPFECAGCGGWPAAATSVPQQDMRAEVCSYPAKFHLSNELGAVDMRPCFSVAAQERRYLCPACQSGQTSTCDYCRSVDPNAAACVAAWHKGGAHEAMAGVEMSGTGVPEGIDNCMRIKATMPAERPYPNVIMTFSCCGQRRKPDRADDVVKYIFTHIKPNRLTGTRNCGGTQSLPPAWEALFEDVTEREQALAVQQAEQQQQQQQQQQQGQREEQGQGLQQGRVVQQGSADGLKEMHAGDSVLQQAEGSQAQPEDGKRKRKKTDKEMKSAAPAARRPYGSSAATVIEASDGRKYVASQACKEIFKAKDYRHLSKLATDAQLQLAQHIVSEGPDGPHSEFLPYASFVTEQMCAKSATGATPRKQSAADEELPAQFSVSSADTQQAAAAALEASQQLPAGAIPELLALPSRFSQPSTGTDQLALAADMAAQPTATSSGMPAANLVDSASDMPLPVSEPKSALAGCQQVLNSSLRFKLNVKTRSQPPAAEQPQTGLAELLSSGAGTREREVSPAQAPESPDQAAACGEPKPMLIEAASLQLMSAQQTAAGPASAAAASEAGFSGRSDAADAVGVRSRKPAAPGYRLMGLGAAQPAAAGAPATVAAPHSLHASGSFAGLDNGRGHGSTGRAHALLPLAGKRPREGTGAEDGRAGMVAAAQPQHILDASLQLLANAASMDMPDVDMSGMGIPGRPWDTAHATTADTAGEVTAGAAVAGLEAKLQAAEAARAAAEAESRRLRATVVRQNGDLIRLEELVAATESDVAAREAELGRGARVRDAVSNFIRLDAHLQAVQALVPPAQAQRDRAYAEMLSAVAAMGQQSDAGAR